MNEHGPDLIRGDLWRSMLRFSIPLIASNLLQAVYNIVDMIIVGRFAGSAGLSAVSIGGQVTMVALCIVMGIANAASVLASQLVGAQRQGELPLLLRTMDRVFAVFALALTVLAWVFTRPLLTELVECITVGDHSDLEITFRFRDAFKEAKAVLEKTA